MTDIGGTVIEPQGLSDVDILLDGCVQKRRVDVETAQLEVTSSGNTEEDAEAS